MVKTQKGFTLIELVLVIVLLGILAAVAVPRFINLQNDANAATVQGVFAAVSSASAMVHGKCLAQNVSTGSIAAEGTTITVTNAYPTADNNGIAAAIGGTPSGFASSGIGPGTFTFTKTGATNPSTCSVTYTAPMAGTAPVIITQLVGC